VRAQLASSEAIGKRRIVALLGLIVLVGAACGGGTPDATARPAAGSDAEYAVAACTAWDALFRAVGNPDTGSGSDLSRALDEAVAAGDVASADRLAKDIARELEVGREHVAVARGWPPRTPVMVHFDRVFTAFEAMIAAKRAAAGHEPGAIDPQAAFEDAGGIEAWFAMLEALRATASTDATAEQCPNVPVTP
jgi:hypothetical protein